VSEVNLDRLRDLAGHLRDAVRQLRELAAIPRAVFLAARRHSDCAPEAAFGPRPKGVGSRFFS